MDLSNCIKSVEKALIILDQFTYERPEWSLADLSRKLQQTKPTILRLLNTLEKYGYVEKDREKKTYCLGMRLFALGNLVANRMEVRTIALPVMYDIRNRTGEAVHLNIISEGERMCVEYLDALHDLRAIVHVGQCSPLYAGGSAKVLMAFMKDEERKRVIDGLVLKPITDKTIINKVELEKEIFQIRQQGYAISCGERLKGAFSISVPIWNRDSRVIASMSVLIPEARMDTEKLDSYKNILIEGGKIISRRMGYVEKNS
ncbi:MAG: IclR family transcriptional regulator [Bacillota bacterium]